LDLTTGAVAIFGLNAVGKPGAEILKHLIERFLGPAVDVGGEALRDWIRARTQRAAATLTDAVKLLSNAGEEPQPVPGRILLPILEFGSLEEDEDLRNRWASLLANAASIRMGPHILPAYTEVLRQLTPIHAKVLDWLFENAEVPNGIEQGISDWRAVNVSEFIYRFGLNEADWDLLGSDLNRLQLIEGRDVAFDTAWTPPHQQRIVGLTPLAIGFLRACRPPIRGSI
jgi:abortive infection alpha-like protein